MSRLYFHPIRGKTLDIINTIIHTDEVESLGDVWSSIRLIIEELVVNVVEYAYPDGTDGYLYVEITSDRERITLCFRDGGVPFNPLEFPSPDTSLPMDQRPIGGLGIFLVKKEMDTAEYKNANGENILTVTKKLTCVKGKNKF